MHFDFAVTWKYLAGPFIQSRLREDREELSSLNSSPSFSFFGGPPDDALLLPCFESRPFPCAAHRLVVPPPSRQRDPSPVTAGSLGTAFCSIPGHHGGFGRATSVRSLHRSPPKAAVLTFDDSPTQTSPSPTCRNDDEQRLSLLKKDARQLLHAPALLHRVSIRHVDGVISARRRLLTMRRHIFICPAAFALVFSAASQLLLLL